GFGVWGYLNRDLSLGVLFQFRPEGRVRVFDSPKTPTPQRRPEASSTLDGIYPFDAAQCLRGFGQHCSAQAFRHTKT
ncbi:hypothetical protein, partial [Oleiphilus sp. HI0080]|uniref:hypothetical protein n=1 Tax=Oleiphilus sp. HI0080 TaxID=1822255 RepID=UPI001E438241